MTTPPPGAADPLVGRVLDGRYRVEAFVARGGMATIYRGADLRLDRTVAIKVMHPSFASDPGFVDRFQREARAAARLSSPHVVAVHDQGTDQGVIYLVMEYVPGHTVRDILRTHGALPPAQALAIIDPVLEALSAAHRAGYVHRDVKPENVLISDDGRVKVTDFGLARAIEGGDSGRTHGLLLGTMAYLSPEQVEHDRTDARSDVYSAGILLFELVTGQVPFSAAAPLQVAYRHVHEDVPAPSTLNPAVPAGVDEVVLRATRRLPDRRYPDATAFLADVRALRAQLPPGQAWAPAPTDTLVVAAPGSPAAGRPASGPGDDTLESAPALAGLASAGAGALAAPAQPHPGPAAAPSAAPADDAAGGSDGTGEEPGPPWVGPPGDAGGPASGPPVGWQPAGGSGAPPAAGAHSTAAEAATVRPRRSRRALALGAIALLSVVGLLVLLFGPFNRVDVPDVLGKTPAEATALLLPANLRLDAQRSDFSEEYPKGQIMATSPGPGQSARSGATVLATVSKGPERYEVPTLAGMTVDEAEVALGATNLTLGEQRSAYDDKVATGDIVSSDPKAGSSVKRDTPVDVVVSKGPAPVDVPAVVGASADSAVSQLKDLGLQVDRSDKYSETVPRGRVISIDPEAGTTVYRGDTVTLVASKGPPLVTVPNVVGMDEREARDALTGAGFAVAVNKEFPVVVFGVRSQSPAGGSRAPKGSTVTISLV